MLLVWTLSCSWDAYTLRWKLTKAYVFFRWTFFFFFWLKSPFLFLRSYCRVYLFSFWDLHRVGVWHKWQSGVKMTYLFLRKFKLDFIWGIFRANTVGLCVGLVVWHSVHVEETFWKLALLWAVLSFFWMFCYLQQKYVNINSEWFVTSTGDPFSIWEPRIRKYFALWHSY